MQRKRLNELFVQIRKKRRRLTPAVVVDEASDPNHPLHREFDWDDASAAHKQRLQHAARLIRLVKVEVKFAEGSINVRQWHAVHAAGVIDAPDGYLPNEEVATTPIYRQAMLRQMERDWKVLESRYEHLKEFWAMVNQAAKKRGRQKAG